MVDAVKEAISTGLTQKQTCDILGIVPRKFRRWANPKPHAKRTAWNKILPEERDVIVKTAEGQSFWGKPVSHLFVHGHESEQYFTSLSTVYRVLKSEKMVRPREYRKRGGPYVSAHKLLKNGFSLLCYDGTRFVTEYGVVVWAIPVMILPYRYLLHIGFSLNGVSSADLVRTVSTALVLLPDSLHTNLIAHSDRGSAMKAIKTKIAVEDLLGAPVHYGRPHTPDDQAWIEAFIKTLKYHREAPLSFKLVDDVINWLDRFPEIYNNDPHSSLKYVTPLQAISGQQEVILSQRRQNLLAARDRRRADWQKNRVSTPTPEVVMMPA